MFSFSHSFPIVVDKVLYDVSGGFRRIIMCCMPTPSHYIFSLAPIADMFDDVNDSVPLYLTSITLVLLWLVIAFSEVSEKHF